MRAIGSGVQAESTRGDRLSSIPPPARAVPQISRCFSTAGYGNGRCPSEVGLPRLAIRRNANGMLTGPSILWDHFVYARMLPAVVIHKRLLHCIHCIAFASRPKIRNWFYNRRSCLMKPPCLPLPTQILVRHPVFRPRRSGATAQRNRHNPMAS